MANYSLQIEPNDNNVYESLKNDTLGNNKWIHKCLNILLTMDNSIVAFDACWGNGKKFLAKQLQMIINEKWDMGYNNKKDSNFSFIRELDFDNINSDSYFAIYYNAWEYDNENDPVASFLYYLLKMLNKSIPTNKFKNIATNLVKNVIEKLSNGWIKLNSDGATNNIEKVLSSVVETEKVREEIRILLNELKEEKCNNLIIFIDELDRCRPTYTLKIIEMIKHYLKMENILIVCMTDIKQLSNCIKMAYGNNYDSTMYLDKIFNFKFDIPNSNFNIKKYINMKIGNHVADNDFFDMVCIEVIDYYNLSLRNVDIFLSYVKTMFIKSQNMDNTNFTAQAFVEYLFVPYYIGIKLFKPYLYEDFMNGNLDDYFKFCKKDKIISRLKHIYRICINSNEFDENKVFDYFKHDCELLINYLKGNKFSRQDYYVNQGCFNDVDYYLKDFDMIDFFIRNTIR